MYIYKYSITQTQRTSIYITRLHVFVCYDLKRNLWKLATGTY